MATCAVCTDADAAQVLEAAGAAVVMMGLDSAALGRRAAELRSPSRGRVAVFVGDPEDPADLASAIVMAHELFGAVPVVVSSVDEAGAVARSPGRDGRVP